MNHDHGQDTLLEKDSQGELGSARKTSIRRQLSDLTNRLDHLSDVRDVREEVSCLKQQVDEVSSKVDVLSSNVLGDPDDIRPHTVSSLAMM